jgi:uncharacterized protein (DUF3084 family)
LDARVITLEEEKANLTQQLKETTSKADSLTVRVAELSKYEIEAKNLAEEVKTYKASIEQKMGQITDLQGVLNTVK